MKSGRKYSGNDAHETTAETVKLQEKFLKGQYI